MMKELVLSVIIFLNMLQTTDAACCSNGWIAYGSHCYWIDYGTRTTFSGAIRRCRLMGGYLTRLETYSEYAFLRNLLRKSGASAAWIGLSDQTYEGIWRWHGTNTHATFSDWGHGQPDNTRGKEHCVGVRNSDYKWNDYLCDFNLISLCEKP